MNRPSPQSLALALGGLAATLGGCGQPGQDAFEVAQAPQDTLASALETPVEVRVANVQRAELRNEATVAGVVSAFRKATVGAEVEGRVLVRAVEPGTPVTAGQELLVLDAERPRISRDQAQAMLRTRTVNAQEAASELARGRNLFTKGFISQGQLDRLDFAVQRAQAELQAAEAQLAAAQRTLADTSVRAPFAGVAELIHAHVGDYLKKGAAVATVADFSRARVHAGVTAAEARRLAEAETAAVALDDLGGRRLNGLINSVARISDPTTGTYAVEIWLDGQDAPLREGMLATVHLPYAGSANQLAVPSAAVFRRQGILHVFLVQDGRARLTPITAGRADSRLIEVVEGLGENQTVVTDGQFALRDGAPVRVVEGD